MSLWISEANVDDLGRGLMQNFYSKDFNLTVETPLARLVGWSVSVVDILSKLVNSDGFDSWI